MARDATARDSVAQVIQLPARAAARANARGVSAAGDLATRAASATTSTARTGIESLMRWTHNAVDDWGRDARLSDRIRSVSGLRWDVMIGGQHHLERVRGGLIVVNSRRFSLSPIWAALHLGRALDRPVRFVGRPDIAPAGPALQRLGGLLSDPAELTRVLASGELVVLGAATTMSPHRVGVVDHLLVGAAVAAKVPVFPAATASSSLQRSARLQIGTAVPVNRRRRGPLAELELADDLAIAIGTMLDEFTWNGWLLS